MRLANASGADNLALKVFSWDFVLCALVLPVNGQDPPALAVIEKLKTVDTAHQRLGIAQIVTRFVSAPNVRDSAKLLGTPRDLGFVETLLQKRFHPRDILFDIQ